MECGGKRSATPLWLVFVPYPFQDEPLKPKRRRASLAAALHMAVADTLNRSPQTFPHCQAGKSILPFVTMPDTPSIPAPVAPKKTHWLFYGCGTLLALLLIIIATVAITLWWIQRPIKPVILSAREKAIVDEKLQHVGGTQTPIPRPSAPDTRSYVPGTKVLKLTEREINGLLNANTDLGKFVRIEFARDAINAYVAVPIPQDFPIGGG